METHINHMFLLKTTHARLVANNIEFAHQIPRHRHALKKLGFTDRQIIDIMECLADEMKYCIVTKEDIFIQRVHQNTRVAGPFDNEESAQKWASNDLQTRDIEWHVVPMLHP